MYISLIRPQHLNYSFIYVNTVGNYVLLFIVVGLVIWCHRLSANNNLTRIYVDMHNNQLNFLPTNIFQLQLNLWQIAIHVVRRKNKKQHYNMCFISQRMWVLFSSIWKPLEERTQTKEKQKTPNKAFFSSVCSFPELLLSFLFNYS